MSAFLANNIIEIILAFFSIMSTTQAIRYRRIAHQQTTEDIVNANKKVKLFLSREAMLTELKGMYDRAEEGDVIWAQCIRCTSFFTDVQTKILEAVGKGVGFQMVIYNHARAKEEFLALFAPFSRPDIRLSADIDFSLQGLSEQEVVITFPESQGYTAICIHHQPFVRLLRHWFLNRFEQMPSAKPQETAPQGR